MAITFSKTTYTGKVPRVWRGECKILPGGFIPAQDFETGTIIPQGTLLYVDYDSLSAAVVKSASIVDGSSASELYIAKGLLFQEGDTICIYGSSTTVTISSIDTDTNSDYDILTLSGDIATSVSEGDIIVESAGYVPNAFVGADIEVTATGILTIDAAYEGVLIYPNLGAPIVDDWKVSGGFALAANQSIKLVKQ